MHGNWAVQAPTTSNQGVEDYEREMTTLLQRANDKKLLAFAILTYSEGGDVSYRVSSHLKDQTNVIIPESVRGELRKAHEKYLESNLAASRAFRPLVRTDRNRSGTFNENQAPIFAHPRQLGPSPQVVVDIEASKLRSVISRKRRDTVCPEPEDLDVDEMIRPDEQDQSSDVVGINTTKHYRILNINQPAAVHDYLYGRLKRMQQLAVKRIAKAWIKGICPKKQARFPYQNKRRDDQGGDIPKWWPPLDRCRFVEPDHIKRNERLYLCLHLLRLRPKPQELKAWNGGEIEPHHTHVTKGWTTFLKELAPASILNDMHNRHGKPCKRQKLLEELYSVARMEEEFQAGAMDASFQMQYVEDDEKTPTSAKRNRRSSIVSDTDSEQSHSSGPSGPPVKRLRAEDDLPFDVPELTASSHGGSFSSTTTLADDTPSLVHYSNAAGDIKAESAMLSGRVGHPFTGPHGQLTVDTSQQYHPSAQRGWDYSPTGYSGANATWDDMSPQVPWAPATSQLRRTGSCDEFNAGMSQPTYAVRQDFNDMGQLDQKPAQAPHHAVYPTNMMHQIPHPQFETVPNTPMFAPNNMLGMSEPQPAGPPFDQAAFGHMSQPSYMMPVTDMNGDRFEHQQQLAYAHQLPFRSASANSNPNFNLAAPPTHEQPVYSYAEHPANGYPGPLRG